MCLMEEKLTPFTDGEIEKENKSSFTDRLFSFIGGYPERQNETVAIKIKLDPTTNEISSFLNTSFASFHEAPCYAFDKNRTSEGRITLVLKDTIRITERHLKDLQDEREAATSYIKTPCRIRKKLEAAINLDRSFNADAVWDEDFGELRVMLESADDNLKTQMLQNQTNNLKEDHPKLEMEKAGLSSRWNDKFLISKKNYERISKDLLDTIRITERHLKDLQDANNRNDIGRIWEEAKNRAIMESKREEEEKKEYIRQLFVMLLLIILIKNIGKNIKCRQTSCRKYPCLNSILYLLWQSGDIEVNPGPANSTTYREWLYQACSIVRKAIAGVTAECKMSNIWKKKPENWPHGELYFDPRNSKGLSVNKVEDFLQILINCCDNDSKLSHEITSELDTWNKHKSKDNDQLLHLYRTRECLKSTEQVDRSLKVLQSNVLPDEILTVEVNPCIRISLSCQPAIHQQFSTRTIYRSEATRRIASFLGRILHGKDPEKKCDHIWTIKPDGWPSNLRYYNPNNGGERCDDNEDGMVVEALISLCGKKLIKFEKTYQDMVDAWQTADQTLLSKLMTRHTAETELKKAVMKLHEEGLLQDPDVDKHLRELGFFVQCDGSTQNAKLKKRKVMNTMNKHETKRTKQSDHEDAVDTTLKELLPDCSIGQLLDNQSDSSLLDMISQKIPDFLEDEADDVQFHWT